MQTILHAIDTGGPGGAETVFMRLASGLDSKKYRAVVAIKGEGWLAGQLRSQGLQPVFIDSKGSFSFKYLWQLIKLIRKYKVDIIQSHLFGSNVYCSLAGLICRVPVVSVFHGNVDIDENDKLSRLKLKIISSGSKKLVFVSDHLKDFIVKQHQLNADQCITVYNGIPLDKFSQQANLNLRAQLSLSKDDLIIGAVGNIRPAKGYDTFIKAAALLVQDSKNYKFIIVGQGDNSLETELKKSVKDLKLQDHVFFLGFQADTAGILNSFDIFVQSSTSEGFSISIVEAMACGLPIIATKSGGPQEILTHDQHALMVDIESPQQIATAIKTLYKDPALRERLSKTARQRAYSTYSLETMLEQYSSIYSQL